MFKVILCIQFYWLMQLIFSTSLKTNKNNLLGGYLEGMI